MLIIILLLSGHKTHLATDSVAHTYRELERESNNKRGFFSSSLSPRRCYCIVVGGGFGLIVQSPKQKRMRRVVLPCELLLRIRKFSCPLIVYKLLFSFNSCILFVM